MCNLSADRNIGKALGTFGIGDNSDYILCIITDSTWDKVHQVRKCVDGVEVLDVSSGLIQWAAYDRICSVYQIDEKERDSQKLLDSIVTRISCRDLK